MTTPIPDGNQVGFVQAAGNTGLFSQVINFATSGSYAISFQGTMRGSSAEPFNVDVDGVNEGLFTPGSSWAPYTTSAFSVSAGTHTVAFVGQVSNNDQGSFIDMVTIAMAGYVGPTILPVTTSLSVSAGATVDLAGNNQPIVSLSDYTAGSGGSVANSNTSYPSTLTLNTTGTSTFSGVIAGGSGLGTINLVISGSGTQGLAGSNTYTGGTTLSSGQLNLNNASALGSGALTISGGTIGNTSGAAITLSTNNAQNWNGDFTFTGSNDLNLGSGAVTMNSSRTVTVASNNLTVGGTISGSGYSLTKVGTGTLTLGGANTYSGGTTLSAGQLNLNNASALSTGALTISGGTIGNTSGSRHAFHQQRAELERQLHLRRQTTSISAPAPSP